MNDIAERRKKSYKEYSELTFTDDFLFCKIMASDPDLCRRVAETVIGRKISRIGSVTIQNAVTPDAESKGVRFDVFFADEEGTLYDIEMQTASVGNLAKRIRYYQALMDLDTLDKGEDYQKLRKSCIAFICLFDAFGQGLPQYTFKETCQELPSLLMNDGTEKVFFCATNKTASHSESAEQGAFLRYLMGKGSEGGMVADLEQAVQRARKNEPWRKQYMTLSEIKAKEYIEGHNDGIKVGLEQGLEQGLERGRNNMLNGMLTAFKKSQQPIESAYQLIRLNPECQSVTLEELRKIWDELA